MATISTVDRVKIIFDGDDQITKVLTKTTASAEKTSKKVTTSFNKATSVFNRFSKSIIAANQGLELVGRTVGRVASGIKKIFMAVVKEGMDFTAQMSAVVSIAKVANEEITALTATALEIGRTTEKTATQVAKGMEELTRAGLSTAEIINSVADAMALATATGASLAQSANAVALVLKLFRKDSLTATRAVDLFSQTAAVSLQTFEDLKESVRKSAGMWSSLGGDFQELTIILGALADSGFKGEVAGVALNSALAKLLNVTPKAADVLARYGLTIDDVNPKLNSFLEVIEELNYAQITEADLLTLIGQVAGPKFIKIIQNGTEALEKFKDSQEGANTAAETAQIRLDNLSGDVILLESQLSGLAQAIFRDMEPALRLITQFAGGVVAGISDTLKAAKLRFLKNTLTSLKGDLEELEKVTSKPLKERSFWNQFKTIFGENRLELLVKTRKEIEKINNEIALIEGKKPSKDVKDGSLISTDNEDARERNIKSLEKESNAIAGNEEARERNLESLEEETAAANDVRRNEIEAINRKIDAVWRLEEINAQIDDLENERLRSQQEKEDEGISLDDEKQAREEAAWLVEQQRIKDRMSIEEQATFVHEHNQRKRALATVAGARIQAAANKAMEDQMRSLVKTGQFSAAEFLKVITRHVEAELYGIAARSAVLALFELAKGTAALAVGSPAASLHFQAAGQYALISGVALASAAAFSKLNETTGAAEPAATTEGENSTGGGAATVTTPGTEVVTTREPETVTPNVTVNIHNPNPLSDTDWDKLVEDEVVPAINRASARDVS